MFGNMLIPEIIGAIVLTIAGIIVICLVAIQDSKSDGISSLAGAGSFLGGSGRDRSLDAKINRIIKYLCAAFFIIVLIVYAFTIYL